MEMHVDLLIVLLITFCAVELTKMQLGYVLNLCLHLLMNHSRMMLFCCLLVSVSCPWILNLGYQDNVAAMAHQYVLSVVGSVQRPVVMAIALSQLSTQLGPKSLPGSPEAHALARWICRSYRMHIGAELFRVDSPAGDAILKQLWHHSDAIMCCSVKANSQIKQAITDSEQAVEVALLILNQEINKLQGVRKAPSVLSKALETDPTSLVLWIVYLLTYYGSLRPDEKDDMFVCGKRKKKKKKKKKILVFRYYL